MLTDLADSQNEHKQIKLLILLKFWIMGKKIIHGKLYTSTHVSYYFLNEFLYALPHKCTGFNLVSPLRICAENQIVLIFPVYVAQLLRNKNDYISSLLPKK